MLRPFAAVVLALASWAGFAAPQPAPSSARPVPAQNLEAGAEASIGAAASSTERVAAPILVYHIVRPAYPSDSASVRALAVTPEIFDAQMAYLRAAGYHVIGFSELEARLTHGTSLPPKPVLLSFDDGWGDQYAYAFPILKKYAYDATFFVFTNAIGRKGFLTWDELKEMEAAGMTIGDHTRSHPYLTKIASPGKLWDEIYGSKTILETYLGVPVREFAYPFGQFDASTTADVLKAGFASARGDFDSGSQSLGKLYDLSAINAPTSLEAFERLFP